MSSINWQRFCLFLMVLTLILGFTWIDDAEAEESYGSRTIKWSDSWHAPRVRALFHNSLDIGSGIERRVHVISPNVNVDHPGLLCFLGINFQLMPHLELEPAVGFDFRQENWIASPRLSFYSGPTLADSKFYTWTSVDYIFGAEEFYYFTQVEVRVNRWLDFGIESEGWGIGANESIGGGFNAIVHMTHYKGHQVNFDLAVHYRDLDEPVEYIDQGWKPEFFLRIHLIPKLDL